MLGWKSSLHAKPREAKKFYICIAGFTLLAAGMNFLGFNPMKALVWSAIVQGFSTPPLLLLILLMTSNRKIMGERVNSRWTNILGGVTTAAIFAASSGCLPPGSCSSAALFDELRAVSNDRFWRRTIRPETTELGAKQPGGGKWPNRNDRFRDESRGEAAVRCA